MRRSLPYALLVFSVGALHACGGGGSSNDGPGSGGSGGLVGHDSGGSGGSGGSAAGDGGTDTGGSGGGSKHCGVTMAATAQVFHVAPDGDDSGDGSAAAPWATITHAVNQAADGSTILVEPGTYEGEVRLDRRFDSGVVVRSAQRYGAKLRHTSVVVRSYSGRNITLEGFDIAHAGSGAGQLVVHVQSTNVAQPTSYIVLRDNVIHDSYNNDLFKLNNAAEHITVEGNVFYNQAGSDEHIDINSVRDCVVQDNVFFNDFAGSGRANGNDTSAFVVVKDSNGNDDGILGTERVTIRRNVFLNWEGSSNYGFLQLGEDGTANFEASDVLIENNLLIGNSQNQMRSPIAMMGVADITFRHNTVVGDFPGPSTFGFVARLYTYGSNQPNENVQFWNNIWSDPTGTMSRFSISPSGETSSFTLQNNLYWNGGAAVPSNDSDLLNVSSDTAALTADPEFGAGASLVVPRLEGTTFADGSATICEAFERLVTNWGTPLASSAALGSADTSQAADHDILLRPRGASPSLGAAER
jgi:hypothetical protein